MDIFSAIKRLFPDAGVESDFRIVDDGPTPVLHEGAEEKGRVRYDIKPSEEGEEPVEGVHFRYGIDYNRLVEGEDYDLVDKGPYIAVWNLEAPQPTEAELQAAWEAYKDAEASKPPDPPSEIEQLRMDNAGLLLELAQVQARQDQADADNAALLLMLAEGGVV
ncbi:XkdW protein [compost metagenome]